MSFQTALSGWHDFYILAGTAAATLVGLLFVGLSLHLRIVVAMYLREGREADVAITGPLRVVASIALLVTLVFGFAPAPLIDQVTSSSQWIAVRSGAVRAVNAGR